MEILLGLLDSYLSDLRNKDIPEEIRLQIAIDGLEEIKYRLKLKIYD